MLRTPIVAALGVALLAGTAYAQPASQAPARLGSQSQYSSDTARNAPDGDDDYGPPPGAQRAAAGPQDNRQMADRDMFCRRDAAARTGYTTPGEAAHDEQMRGTVGGTLGGAALGAIIGAGAGNAGLGAAAGAGAGLIAGSAIGSDNARHAAADVQAAYGDAYYACMHEDGRQAAGYGYDAPPPPAYGYPVAPYPYYGYGYGPYAYPGYYYGPSISFGIGGGWGGRGWGGGHGYHGGGHHR